MYSAEHNLERFYAEAVARNRCNTPVKNLYISGMKFIHPAEVVMFFQALQQAVNVWCFAIDWGFRRHRNVSTSPKVDSLDAGGLTMLWNVSLQCLFIFPFSLFSYKMILFAGFNLVVQLKHVKIKVKKQKECPAGCTVCVSVCSRSRRVQLWDCRRSAWRTPLRLYGFGSHRLHRLAPPQEEAEEEESQGDGPAG